MIEYETFCRLRRLYDEAGLKVSQIATELQLDPKTVERWVNQRSYRQRQGTKRASKLDPFKQQVAVRLARHPYPIRPDSPPSFAGATGRAHCRLERL